ncbi:hypothetical protein [Sphaerisporangium sp. NPDC051011]|uniref:hypothetical protein n=1 Tax=Sphaerisporangium sp. NPDC051011 TaxID=3155792 RepID=UPI0033D2147F
MHADELDMYAVLRPRAAVDLAMRARRPPRLVLDLDGATFCDSLTLGLPMSTLNRVREAGAGRRRPWGRA